MARQRVVALSRTEDAGVKRRARVNVLVAVAMLGMLRLVVGYWCGLVNR